MSSSDESKRINFLLGTLAKTAPKRKSTDTSSSSSKRQRTKNEDGLICCISLALPLDPVTAEDGRIYERTAIEDYFKSKGDGRIRSPITRQTMGTKLLSSPQIKSTIETLIENGAIKGPPADDWKKRMEEKKEMEALLKDAAEGDVDAMEIVAVGHHFGSEGFKRDLKEAFKWYEKARVAGSVLGMATAGDFLVVGVGVDKNICKGMMYLGMAAGKGSDLAAYTLGLYMAKGWHGVPVDKVEAQKLLEKSLSGTCPYENMSNGSKLKAQKALDEIITYLRHQIN